MVNNFFTVMKYFITIQIYKIQMFCYEIIIYFHLFFVPVLSRNQTHVFSNLECTQCDNGTTFKNKKNLKAHMR